MEREIKRQGEWKEVPNLDRQLFALLTDEKIKKFVGDYKYSLSWQEAKRAEAIFNIREHLYYGIKDIVSQLLSEREEMLKEIKKTLDGESIYEKNGMSKLEVIEWIVETELDKLLKSKK